MSDDEKKPAESTMDRIEAARAVAAAARAARDAADLETIAPMLIEHPEYGYVAVPLAAPTLPGFVVFRPPSGAEVARFRTTLWNDKSDAETKSKAGIALAAACRVWPSVERAQALYDAHPMAQDAATLEVKRLAEGGAREASKK